MPVCDTILILKYVESIETDYSFGYNPLFLGPEQLVFLNIFEFKRVGIIKNAFPLCMEGHYFLTKLFSFLNIVVVEFFL